MFSLGDWKYSKNGTATLFTDPGVKKLLDADGNQENRTLRIDGLRVGGSAQTTSALGLYYRGKQYYYCGASSNYYGNMYKSFNPSNKTNTEAYFLQNQRIPDAFTLDIYGGKSWKVKYSNGKKVYVKLKANINNVLDNRFLVRGFEGNISAADPYADGFSSFYFGRTYFLALELNL